MMVSRNLLLESLSQRFSTAAGLIDANWDKFQSLFERLIDEDADDAESDALTDLELIQLAVIYVAFHRVTIEMQTQLVAGQVACLN